MHLVSTMNRGFQPKSFQQPPWWLHGGRRSWNSRAVSLQSLGVLNRKCGVRPIRVQGTVPLHLPAYPEALTSGGSAHYAVALLPQKPGRLILPSSSNALPISWKVTCPCLAWQLGWPTRRQSGMKGFAGSGTCGSHVSSSQVLSATRGAVRSPRAWQCPWPDWLPVPLS